MNRIEMSEKIRDHLIAQHGKSVSDSGSCKYRTDNGRMCAVGCLITDEAYYPGLEGKVATDSKVIDALKESGIEMTDELINLFREWQQYHDHDCGDYMYSFWVQGHPDHSPQSFHEYINRV